MRQPRQKWNEAPYGRIRLYEHTSSFLLGILLEERDRLLIERRDRDPGRPATEWNQKLARVDQILSEINRMRSEKQWS